MMTTTSAADRKPDKRDAILKAAWALIQHYGYGKTTIDDIARKAEVGKGTVYLYFRSKKDIMLALTDLTNDRITREIERIATGDGPPEVRLRACLVYRIMTLFDIVNRSPHGDEVFGSILPEIVERLEGYVLRHGEILGRIVEEGCAAGVFAAEDPGRAGRLLADLFEFMTPPYYRFDSRGSLERFTNDVLDLVLKGFMIAPVDSH